MWIEKVTYSKRDLYTVSYLSKDAGDLYIQAICNGIFSIQTYVEDCRDYDSMTSDSGKWIYPTGVNHSFSTDGVSLSSSTTWEGSYYAQGITAPSLIEYELTAVDRDSAYVNIWDVIQTGDRSIQVHCTSNRIYFDLDNTSIYIGNYLGVYQFKVYYDKVEFYKDGTLLKTVNTSFSTNYIVFTPSNGFGTFSFKNFKIKTL